ncbi:tRNA uridine-5-carboxymethylaminomethyl(34) synthesis GTPase MnmE [Bradymonas sediminis]|uniref:tRNA modification GTPase MnmE n=1 Tax=Bradymonas sediminis TaxID=1548548 RepID=A0A2Z4FHR2_9DELT|nr:tRNA uridine-5-carboxymethylaminomethyl(34) synthesis GTPase MnmE [Bradymonas sediminis]AWV88206.1 tRNA uridine-5-carboxymethylaminomethyl(34) synthesis GTPase MnmE [Bradymonas sediminis]TDP77328.1 tRNA modification GTPase [Bradymonas sediminis]
MKDTNTIAAIATPAGRGGVGIIRVSGQATVEILNALVPDWPAAQASHHLRLSKIYDEDGALVDEALVVLMRGPNTYTGEDVCEFQCHGGPIILRRVLDAALATGARIAGPGEFTQRAFLNGRLDLTQAEAVADLIEATSLSAHKLAMEHLQGSLGEAIRGHQERVAQAMVLVESAIDFSHEEHVYQIERDEILARVDETLAGLRKLRRQFDQGRRQREGIRVVILGPPNAGKSTLFNALHGSERAIVTSVAGTTRDFIEEEIHLGGIALRIIDTAGLRDTPDEVEAIGIERSRELQKSADLVVWLVDSSQPLPADQRVDLEQTLATQVRCVVVRNKSDLPSGLSAEDVALLDQFPTSVSTTFAGESSDESLERLIAELVEIGRELSDGEGVLLSRARHLEGVVGAIEALERAGEAVRAKLDHEFVALDLREALDSLGEIVGHVSADDILNRIFSEFCVGK